jgi:hypothetical protein
MTADGSLASTKGSPFLSDQTRWLGRQRHLVINTLLGGVLAISTPAILYTVVITVRRGSLTFTGGYYLATYIITASLYLARRIHDGLRVIATLAVVYGFALPALYTGWLAGSGRGFLLALILVSGLLVQLRISRFVAAAAVLTYLAFGWAYAAGWLDVRTPSVTDVTTILSEGVGFMLAVAMVVTTQIFLGRAIEAANQAEQEARQA